MWLRKSNIAQFLLYAIIAIAFYLPAHRYGMVTDFLSWIYKYQAGTWADIPSSFGYRGLHPVFHFFNFAFFKLFGLNKLAWCIFFAFLHGTNAYLLKTVVSRWLRYWNIERYEAIAVISSICFLIGPYQVEVVTWKACMHYLLASAMILSSFHFLLLHLKSPSEKKFIFFHHALFILSLFTLEVSLAVPFIFLCFILFHRMFGFVRLKKHLLLFSLPQLLIIVLYFLLNKLILGDWVGHYGAENHFAIGLEEIIGNAFKYLSKYVLLSHYWVYGWKDFFYPVLETKLIAYPLIILAIGLAFWGLKSFGKINRKLVFAAVNLLMFFMALVPIVTLYFMYVVPYQNDRYGYLASLFIYPAIIAVFFSLSRKVYTVLIPAYVFALMFLGYKSINECRNASKILDHLIYSFESCETEEVILLGLPDNYKGKYLYRDLTDQNALTFVESIDLFSDKNCSKTSIIDAVQFNQERLSDRILVNKKDSITYELKFGQYRNWWWKDGIGFRNFSNESIEVKEANGKILVKDLSPNRSKTFLRVDGVRWQKVN